MNISGKLFQRLNVVLLGKVSSPTLSSLRGKKTLISKPYRKKNKKDGNTLSVITIRKERKTPFKLGGMKTKEMGNNANQSWEHGLQSDTL